MNSQSTRPFVTSRYRQLVGALGFSSIKRVSAVLSVVVIIFVAYYYLISGIAARYNDSVLSYLFDIDAVMAAAAMGLTLARLV
jgi:hypothetical protein